jgi:hypothetical protein
MDARDDPLYQQALDIVRARGRPPLGLGSAGGNNGTRAFHSSSLTNGFLIPSAYHAEGF